MQKVALVSKEDHKLISSIIIELYKSKLSQWSASEKKQIKAIILDLSKIFSALPEEEIKIEKLDLSLAHEGIIKSLKDKEKALNENQEEEKKLIGDFVQVLKLYQEILQGVRAKYEFNRKTEEFEGACLDQVAEMFMQQKIFEEKGREKIRGLVRELECN